MRRNALLFLLVFASLAAGCSDRATAPRGDGAPVPTPSVAGTLTPAEALARALARSLKVPAARAHLRAALDRSPVREHKLHFQRFVNLDDQPTLRALATEAEANAAIPLELYLPVPAHRAAWHGDGRVLVATALKDGDVPVAFDTAGNRYLLSPDVPPAIPVLALVPVEADFAPRPDFMLCSEGCGSGSGGGGQPAPGLYMTQAHFVGTFEGWLKGSPEFEVHILGQKGTTDSLTDYQCAGETQPTPYYFDQNSQDWTGSVMLFSQTQLDSYKSTHPGQSMRVFVVEDDDTACEIKTDHPNIFAVMDSVFGQRTAGRDTTSSLGKKWKAAIILEKLYRLVASLINTNDELVGNAVADSVATEYHSGYNWVVKDAKNGTNGWIKLEMR